MGKHSFRVLISNAQIQKHAQNPLWVSIGYFTYTVYAGRSVKAWPKGLLHVLHRVYPETVDCREL